MSECDHPWHSNPALIFPCPACGASEDDDMTDYKHPSVLRDVPSTASAHTDYHELPEVPRCCLTCACRVNSLFYTSGLCCTHPARNTGKHGWAGYPEVAPHGLCSHWERRDDGG